MPASGWPPSCTARFALSSSGTQPSPNQAQAAMTSANAGAPATPAALTGFQSVELGDEGSLGVRGGFQLEVDAADLARVGGLDLHLPVARLVARLHAVAAEALLAAAEDLDRDGVLQDPAARR